MMVLLLGEFENGVPKSNPFKYYVYNGKTTVLVNVIILNWPVKSIKTKVFS